MYRPLIGGVRNHVGICLERLDAEQAIMVRRLKLRRDAQPLAVRIEVGRHGVLRWAVVARRASARRDNYPTLIKPPAK